MFTAYSIVDSITSSISGRGTRHPGTLVMAVSCTLAAACITPAPANAADLAFQSHESIQSAAVEHLRGMTSAGDADSLTITAGNMDPRLRLPRCGMPLEAFLPPAARVTGHTSVGVRCSGNKPWTLYVSVRVSIARTVLVSRTNLPRDHQISASDLEPRLLELRSAREFFETTEALVGQVTRRPVAAGTAISADLVKVPVAVRRGDSVIVVAQTNGIAVRMPGKAAETGAVGARIRVENLRSGRLIDALVTAPGEVSVTL